jgi:PDGLE domain
VSRKWLPVVVAGLAIALGVALISPLASSSPDGLERVAEDEEFTDKAEDNGYEIIPDYTFPGVDDENVATILSGVIGVAIVAAVGFGLALFMRTISRKSDPEGDKASRAPGRS